MNKCPVCSYDLKSKPKIEYTNLLLFKIFTTRRKRGESWKEILSDLANKTGLSKITVYRMIRKVKQNETK